jgi:Fur family peroxide stress response transcriptional regulator
MVQVRQTKYLSAVAAFMQSVGHASNMQILQHLRQQFPELSATTVHRITTRMVERGELALAPVTPENSQRYDANLAPHDHFECADCGLLRDITITGDMREALQCTLGDCRFTGQLNIRGTCANCLKKENV